MTADIDTRVRALEDERAITAVLHAYGPALDQGAEKDWIALFAPEALFELRYRDGLVPRAIGTPELEGQRRLYRGRHALAGFARAHSRAPAAWHKHFVAGIRVDLHGDTAEADSYFARLDAMAAGLHVVAAGRYRDRLARQRDGRWRFVHRIAEIDMQA